MMRETMRVTLAESTWPKVSSGDHEHAARQLAISRSLSAREGLKERRPIVDCTTCHRGQLKPALSLPSGDVQTAPASVTPVAPPRSSSTGCSGPHSS